MLYRWLLAFSCKDAELVWALLKQHTHCFDGAAILPECAKWLARLQQHVHMWQALWEMCIPEKWNASLLFSGYGTLKKIMFSETWPWGTNTLVSSARNSASYFEQNQIKGSRNLMFIEFTYRQTSEILRVRFWYLAKWVVISLLAVGSCLQFVKKE